MFGLSTLLAAIALALSQMTFVPPSANRGLIAAIVLALLAIAGAL